MQNQKKKMMILGAGYAQIPIIEAAKRIGIHTLVASIPGPYDGFAYADEIVHVDISDPEAVLQAAKEHQIDGVGTCSLDLGMAAIGKTAERLCLKGPSENAARLASNKLEMKKALASAGVLTPKFFVVRNHEDFLKAKEELQLPVVTKATDLMGSRGIYRCNTFEEAEEYYKRSIEDSKLPFCLIEEYIDGELFCIEGLMEDGEPVFMLPNNTEPYESAVRTSVGHSIPWCHPELMDQAIETATNAAKALGLNNCPVDMDVILKDGKIYIIEITGRSGATGLAELVSAHFGIDYYEAIARLAIGETIRPYFDHPNEEAVIVRTICSERGGIVSSVDYEGIDEGVRVEINVHRGQKINKYTNGRDRIGQMVVHHEDPSECRRMLKRALMNTTITTMGDVPLIKTPIQYLLTDEFGNEIYVKREDLLPFSFGGNKVRFAAAYWRDMQVKGSNALIMYGGENSNLCRILSAMGTGRDLPLARVHNVDDDVEAVTGGNCELILMCGGSIYPCHKKDIAKAVQQAMDDLKAQGLSPYYIYGNIYGQGNAHIPMEEYHKVYEEILMQEKELDVTFDQIYLASGTNTTQSGLLAGHLERGDHKKIIGISVTRNAVRAKEVMLENLADYQEKTKTEYLLDPEGEVIITDQYLCGGYAHSCAELEKTAEEMYLKYALPLDPTYTGKAWWGMTGYIRQQGIRNQKILFMHTGGGPLFLDAAYKKNLERESGIC